MILFIFLVGLQIFPDNSEDFTAYGVVQGGGWSTYLLTNLVTDDPYICFLIGVSGTFISHVVFYKHFSTDREQCWASIGRGHYIVLGFTYATIKALTKKDKPIAYAEKIKRR